MFTTLMRLQPLQLEQVMHQPCAPHDPLEDDDSNMDDDEIDKVVVGDFFFFSAPAFDTCFIYLADAWNALCGMVESVQL
jgi:hypothetical protein